jgi:FkbM family methyltransferase
MFTSLSKRFAWSRVLRQKRRGAQRRLRSLTATVRSLGSWGAVLFWSQRWGFPLGRRGGRYRLLAKHAAHPLDARAGSSDGDVFRNVFVEQAYACIDEVDDVRLVVDCGANVGYASAYFLTRYPHAGVVAVEPDEGNYQMLRRNTAPYGDRIKAFRSGVWSHRATLVMDDSVYRDGREWSRQVREARPGDVDGLAAVDVDTLLHESGHARISILKVDIEGAEAVMFSDGYESWLSKVDNILIELHDDSGFGDCTTVFYRAIAGQDFTVSRVGNLTICKREGDQPD